MNSHREKEYERLTRVTLLSNDAIKKLTQVKEQGDKILRAAEMCRRMETEEEKVLPFYTSSLTPEEQEELQEAAEAELKMDQLAKTAIDYQPMENFWKRYNKVQKIRKFVCVREEFKREMWRFLFQRVSVYFWIS